ncbi:MAG TPA: hypothetical protein PKD53_06165 [Chloroflexaceae bacterium]|mgnify:CR=1 FL=1|nr:hypothetical protein [Chloroflexaceae bacterium]
MTPQQQQAMLRLRQLLAEPASPPAEIAATYVTIISEQLLQFARQAHARDGAGVVEIDLRGIDLRTATGTAPIAYYPADSGSEEWPPNLDELLETYDPAREAVVLLFQDGSGPQIYVLE